MPGYPRNIFVHQPALKFLCILCSEVLRDPTQTVCGHRYCRKCLQDSVESSGTIKCKGCEVEDNYESILTIEDINSDRAILRELNEIEVRCQNDGCLWKGLYKEYCEGHESLCPFATVRCIHERCRAQMRRKDLTEHLERNCIRRPVTCQFCNDEVTYEESKSHQKQCPKYPVICQYCGRKDILREKIAIHQDLVKGDCKKKPIPCHFKDVGCDEMVDKNRIQDHNTEFIGKHILMVLNVVTTLLAQVKVMKDDSIVERLKRTINEQQKRIESLASDTQKLETKVTQVLDAKSGQSKLDNGLSVPQIKTMLDKLDSSLKELKDKQTVLHTKANTFDGVVAVLNNQVEHDENMMQTLKSERIRDRELIEGLERKIKAQDKIIAVKDVALAEQDLRIQSLEMASYDGVLLWKISDFERKRHDAISGRTTSIYSPCFYTSRHGYKMCARIYLNGDGMGKGNHVSVFFTIMKGLFDALLRWPFRQKVTLMWLDQNYREHVIDAFRPDPTSSSFKRPTQDMNIASGCPLFMPLSQLDSPRHAYVRDDVAFLKVIVDTSDLI
ncbi:TNF receptor-associated factor 2-like [Ptychodera flava]|uniref:TNF receptor-associated factor 2-like n=1 Tax=Ptychodera flava TaxID=63121 RepID=UPI00396A9589